ncbi:hypothetical protein JTB14_029040 [Gonioctena quinquepunctata]|nr:hypothetical protein JTB14_029040 [Gonioctena quinquepunctata]
MIERVVKTNEATPKCPGVSFFGRTHRSGRYSKGSRCFEEATKTIQGNTIVTIFLVIPLTFGIYNSLNLPELQTEEGKTFCNNILQSVRTRLFPYETRSVARLGTILDPRFKKEGFRSAENAAYAATLLEQEMFSIMKKPQNTSLNVAEISSEKPKQSSTLFGFSSDRVKVREKPITADVIITKRQYLERPDSNTDVDPLLFWKVAGEDPKPNATSCTKILLHSSHLCIKRESVQFDWTIDRESAIKIETQKC